MDVLDVIQPFSMVSGFRNRLLCGIAIVNRAKKKKGLFLRAVHT